MPKCDYGEGLVVDWTEFEYQKICEIKARTNRLPKKYIIVRDDHPFAETLRRKQRDLDEQELKRRLEKEKSHERYRQRVMKVQSVLALLSSGLSRRKIADIMGMKYMNVVKIAWRHEKKQIKENQGAELVNRYY